MIHIKLKKSEAGGSSFIGITQRAGIEKLNSVLEALIGTVGVTVTEEVDVCRNFSRQDMDQMKFFPLSIEGTSQGVVKIEVVVSENDFEMGGEAASLIENRFAADIAKVPDLVDPLQELGGTERPMIMSIGDDSDAVIFGGRIHF